MKAIQHENNVGLCFLNVNPAQLHSLLGLKMLSMLGDCGTLYLVCWGRSGRVPLNGGFVAYIWKEATTKMFQELQRKLQTHVDHGLKTVRDLISRSSSVAQW